MLISDIFSDFRELNIYSMVIRFAIAFLCGLIIGIGRGRQQRAAGMRTHILVCVGACSTMVLGQYLMEMYNSGDVARLGAQVISGMGFLGAGTIIVTGHNQIKGLTTAAGLWASACTGLAAGAGFYECAIIMCATLILVLVVLGHLDDAVIKSHRAATILVESDDKMRFGRIVRLLKANGWTVRGFEILGKDAEAANIYTIDIVMGKGESDCSAMLKKIRAMDGVLFADTL